MPVKLLITRKDPETVGVTVHGDAVTEGKPDAGELLIRVVDPEEVDFFVVGATYRCVKE